MPDCRIRRRFPRRLMEKYCIPYVQQILASHVGKGDCKIVLDITNWQSPVSQGPLGQLLKQRYPSCRLQRKAAHVALETYFSVCSSYTSYIDPDHMSKYNRYQLWRCYLTLKQSLTAHVMWHEQFFKEIIANDNPDARARMAQRRTAFWSQRVLVDEPSIRIVLGCLKTQFREFCWRASEWSSVDVDRESTRLDGTIMAGVLISILQEFHQNLCFGNRTHTLKLASCVVDGSRFWLRGLDLIIAFFMGDARHFNSPGSVVDYNSCVDFFPYLPLPFVSAIVGSFLNGCYAVRNVSKSMFEEFRLSYEKMINYIACHLGFFRIYLPHVILVSFSSDLAR